MSVTPQIPPDVDIEEATLANDERWHLVHRILSSEGFQRAGQLRKILIYISRSAILDPERVFHEYEIACDVLDRRPDFDPANDNIVRAQVSHLRRKLEKYFAEDNPSESILLTIPRGSYIPHFLPNPHLPSTATDLTEPVTKYIATTAEDPRESTPLPKSTAPWWRTWTGVGFLLCASACLVLGIVLMQSHTATLTATTTKPSPGNGFIPFLARWDGNVSVVLPDTSESMIQFISGVDISASDYASSFPNKQIDVVKDPEVRRVLTQLAGKRNTTVTEAKLGFEFVDALTRAGGHGTVRYARDFHVRDFNEGSIVLIGAQPSNPWLTLFTNRTNFLYGRNPVDHRFCFMNLKPLPGEAAIYPIDWDSPGALVNYVDIAFLPNPMQNGYILLVVGTDMAAGEAGGNLILHGKLPPKVQEMMTRKDPGSFEIFLRGRHIVNDAEDSLEVLSVRTEADMPAQDQKLNR